MTKILVALTLSVFAFTPGSKADLYTIEPDNYADSTVLDHAVPPVNLITALSDNSPVSIFHVTASYDAFGFASTGTNVFGHVGIPFFNSDRRLRMDFTMPANFISIDFIGGDLFTNDVGELDAFDSSGNLLASYVTGPRPSGGVETMTVFRSTSDIAWAVAYVPPGFGSFGRLDNLQFTVVPEPSVAAIFLGGVIGLWLLLKR